MQTKLVSSSTSLLFELQNTKNVVTTISFGKFYFIGAMPEEIQVDFALGNHTYRFALADLFKKWSRDRQNPDSRRWPSAIATKLQRAFWKSFIGKKK
jgi:hypothetical protein